MPLRRGIIFLVIITAMLVWQPLFVLSEENSGADEKSSAEIEELNRKIAEKRKKVDQIEESIERVKKDINQTRLKKVSFQNQVAILNNRTKQTELDIEATQEKIDTLELEIQAFALQIGQKEGDINRQKTIIAEFIRTLHYENGKSYLEILAAYDNFSDFYNRLQYLQSIEGDLGKSAKHLRLAKADLENKQEQTEARQESYTELKTDLDEKKKDFQEQTFAKENLLLEAKSSEQTFAVLLENLRQQYQEIEGEIASIEQEVRRRLQADQLKEGIDAAGKFAWPTQSRYITARFHDPDYPYRHIFEHNGVDIRAGQGTPITAAGSGYIARAKQCGTARCYSFVMIIHSSGLATVYGHLSSVAVQEDQFVTRGDVVGYSGGTPGTSGAGPFVTGPHLHFEVRKNGIPVDALGYLVRDY